MAEMRADLVGDSRSLVKSVENVAEALEEVTDELKDVSKDGDKAESSLEDNFRAIARAAREADEATEKIGSTTRKATREAGGATSEFKDEAKQNFGEVASSFSGDMASAADLVQGTLGGLAASLGGPLGLALGAASIALGAVIAQAQADAEKAEELRLQAVEAVKSAFEEGVDVSAFLASTDQVVERIQELEESKTGTDARWWWEDDPSRLEEWAAGLEAVGRSGEEIGQVLGTKSVKALRDYKRGLEEAQRAADDAAESTDMTTDAGADQYRQLLATSEAYGDVIKNVEDEIRLREDATASEKRQSDAGLQAAAAAEEAAQRRKDAADAVAESIDAAYQSMVEDATAYATAEDGALDINRWLTYVQEHAGAVATYQANLALLSMSAEDWTALLAMPEEARVQWVAQVAALPEEARQPFIDGLDGIVGNAATTASTSFEEGFTPEAEADVTVTADTTKVSGDIAKITEKAYTATVKVKADTAAAQAAVDAVGKGRTVTVSVSANTSQTDTQLRNYKPPTVYVPAVLVKPGTRQPI